MKKSLILSLSALILLNLTSCGGGGNSDVTHTCNSLTDAKTVWQVSLNCEGGFSDTASLIFGTDNIYTFQHASGTIEGSWSCYNNQLITDEEYDMPYDVISNRFEGSYMTEEQGMCTETISIN